MTTDQLFQQFLPLNEDEQFYKEYYLSRKSPTKLRQFLSSVNAEDIKKRHLVVPEIAPDIISYTMSDDEYFCKTDQNSIYISRHNRYTPSFLHKHEFFEVVFVLSGYCTQTIGLQLLKFETGDICLIAPGVYHTMEVFDDHSLIFNFLLRRSTFYQMFTPLTLGDDLLSQFFSEGLYNTNQIEYLIFHVADDPMYPQALLEMYNEQLHRDEYSDQIMVGILTKLTALMMRQYKGTMESSFSRQQSAVSDNFLIMNYMQKHLNTVSLSDVAKHFNFSVSYCSRLIKATTGVKFNDWKRMLRLRRAEHLLLDTNQTIAEISVAIGYENPESFIRAFKREFHLSPTEYRKQPIR